MGVGSTAPVTCPLNLRLRLYWCTPSGNDHGMIGGHASGKATTRPITVWLMVRVLPGPPRSPALNEISWRSPNTRDFAGVKRSASSLCKEEGLLRASLGPSVSGARKPFPGTQGRRGQRLGSHATETGLQKSLTGEPSASANLVWPFISWAPPWALLPCRHAKRRTHSPIAQDRAGSCARRLFRLVELGSSS
jgi:hypothetical protein